MNINEKEALSPEPQIHKPHIGNNKRMIRERNLNDLFQDDILGCKETERDEINEFLESFDTGKDNFN